MVKQKKADKRKESKLKPKKRRIWPYLLIGIIAVVAVGIVILYSGSIFPPTSKATVGIVDQFYNDSPDFTNNLITFLQSKNITYELHTGPDLTVELYRKLPTFGYKLIILRVHCGISEEYGNPVYMFTTQNYSQTEYTYEQLTDQIKPGVLDIATKENPVFSVGPLFVSSSMQGNFSHSLVLISSCYGTYNSLLTNAFLNKGASGVVSWNDLVSLDHTDDGIFLFTRTFIEDGLSVSSSVTSVMQMVGPDPTYQSILKYYPSASGSETWAQLIG